ncbi:MAG: DNA gyrase subunit A [Acidobacteriota bacterium]
MTDDHKPMDSEMFLAVDIEEEMKRSYIDYAMSVIIGRALPDVRDGLKPVHRRVLYGMWESGNTSNKAYKKSARIVGDVMGKYHPHGDSAIYDTVVRLAQDFAMRYPLVDGQGNFGSIDGDNPAAMRYTEVRLSKLAEELLKEDIDKDTVDWVENYDGSESEPVVLPARLPNLLINGGAGIAVGMATNIPPHNLNEVISALELLIDRPNATFEELLEVIPGPDFPTGAIVYGLEGIRSGYRSGRGIVKVRARCEIEEISGDRQAIIVEELPYQVNKARLLERIAELVREKKIEGISDLRDESDRRGIRVVIELRRGEIAQVMLNTLYKMTQLQTTFGINMLAIVDNQPKVLSLRQLLVHFLNHRKTVVIRRTRFDLAKAERRAHILEGLLKALDLIDEVIATIRASATPPEARERLQQNFGFSALQAQAILDMRLQRLTGLERDKVVGEYKELMALIERLRAILGSDQLVLEEIRGELRDIAERYEEPRRTQILPFEGEITLEDMIADEDMVITVTRTGYVKRSPLALYRAQHRGGKGRMGMSTKDGDFVEHLYIASAHSYILVFTESGRVHWLKVHEIPEFGPAARGKAIVNLLQLSSTERVATTVAVREFDAERSLIFSTARGLVKKTALAAYGNPRVGGIIGINIDEGDSLLAVRVANPGQHLLLATRLGYCIRFPEEDVRTMGRATRGVKGIQLREGDEVVSMGVLAEPSELEEGLSEEAGASELGPILTVSREGYGKRTPLKEYRLQGRGGLGIINLKVNERTGPVVGAVQVTEDQGLMLITQDGKIIRIEVSGVSVIGRATQGVRVMNLDDGDALVAVARIQAREDDELGEDEEGSEEGADLGAEDAEDEPVN